MGILKPFLSSISSMKFPITREQILSFDPVKNQEEDDDVILTKHIEYTLYSIAKAFKEYMMHPKRNPESTAFIIRNIEYMRGNIRNSRSLEERLHKKEVYYPRLLEELRKNYIDCTITLNDYLMIDWSLCPVP